MTQLRSGVGNILGPVAIAVLIVLTLGMLIFTTHFGCGVGEEGEAALHKAGYTDVEIGDHAWFACGRDDSYASHFVARNPVGRQVEGIVCCGVSKGCTIRF